MEGTDRTFIEPFVTLTYLAGGDRADRPRAPRRSSRSAIRSTWPTASPRCRGSRAGRSTSGIGAGNFQHEFDVIGQGDVKRPEHDARADADRAPAVGRRDASSGTASSTTSTTSTSSRSRCTRCRSGGAARRRRRPGSPSTSARAGCPAGSPSRPTRRASRRSGEMSAEQGKPMIMTGAVPVTSIDDDARRRSIG